MMLLNFSDIAILKIKGSDYYCIISKIIKTEAINLIQKCQFDRKKQNIMKHKSFLSQKKMGIEILI